MKTLLIVLALLLSTLTAQAQVQVEKPPIELSEPQEARYRALLPDLRCLVCQNESIADSTAPLALDLRYQVRQQLAVGRSDAEIKHYLTDRYGDFVLFRPPFRLRTWLLWIGPFALALLGVILLVVQSRRGRSTARLATPAVDADALRRLLDETPREGRS
jgi:cytochrome c-type biogenesis protein CcmH